MLLKAYKWEREKFPHQQKIEIRPQYRVKLAEKLAERLGIRLLSVLLTTRGGGFAVYPSTIKLPLPSYPCYLSLIYHELAHLHAYQVHHHKGHTGEFRRSLIKVYIEAKPMLPKIFAEIRQKIAEENKIAEKKMQSEIRKAERIANQKALRKTTEYKISHLEARIKRLETRKKRIETLLKSAKRSFSAYQRKKNKNSLSFFNRSLPCISMRAGENNNGTP